MVLKDCSVCLVYTPKGKRFAEALVVHTKDHVTLYFSDYKLHDERMLTVVDFYDDQAGLIRALCSLLIRRNPAYPNMPMPWMADCEIIEVGSIIQRQQDIRAKVHLEVNFNSEKHGFFHGVIRNISAGGLYVTTSQPLDRDELISFPYRFRKIERTFYARTLRAKRVGDIEYGYGCRFVDLSDSAEAVIREFVFKTLKDKERGKKR